MGQAIEREVSRIMGLDASGAEMEKAAIDFMNKNLGADADAAKMAEFAAKMIDGKTKEGVAFRNYLLGKSRVNDAIQAVVDESDGAITEKDIERALSRDASRLDSYDEYILRELQGKLNEIVHPSGEVSVEQERINGSNDARDSGAGTDKPNEEMLAELDAKRKAAGEAFMAWLKGGTEEAQQVAQNVDENTGLDELVQNYIDLVSSGYRKETLTVFADYINAMARHEGFQAGIATNIEESVNIWGELVKHSDMDGKVVMFTDAEGKTWYVKGGAFMSDPSGKVTAADEGGILLVDGDGHTRMTDGKDMTYVGTAGLEEARDGRRKELMDKSGMGEEGEGEKGGGTGDEGGTDEGKGDNPPKSEEGEGEGGDKGGEGENPPETEEQRIAREEAERKAKEEAERKAEEERAAAEAERKRKEAEEAERKRKEEEERKAAEEAERKRKAEEEAERQKDIKEKEDIINADTEASDDQKEAALDYLHGESSSALDKLVYDAIMRRHEENQEKKKPINKAKKALAGYKVDGLEVTEATVNEDGSIDCSIKINGKESPIKVKLEYDEDEKVYIVSHVEAEYKDIPFDELRKLYDQYPAGEDGDERIIDIDEETNKLVFTSLDYAIDFERWRERKPIMDEAARNINKLDSKLGEKLPEGAYNDIERSIGKLREAIDNDNGSDMLNLADEIRRSIDDIRKRAAKEGTDIKDLDEDLKAIERELDKVVETAKGKGYDYSDKYKVGETYKGGAIAKMETDPSLPPGAMVIDKIESPEITYKGKTLYQAYIVVRRSDKAVPFDPNKPLTEEEKELSERFDEFKEEQERTLGDIQPARKPTFNVKEYNGDATSPYFKLGVYHDEEGYGVAVAGTIIYYDKELYDESHKGEIISTGAAKTHPAGTAIDGTMSNGKKYPNWRSSIPKEETPHYTYGFNPSKLSRMLAAFKSAAFKAKDHALFVRFPDGRVATMSLENMLRFAKAAEKLGATELKVAMRTNSDLSLSLYGIYAETDKGGVFAAGRIDTFGEIGKLDDVRSKAQFVIDLKDYQAAAPKKTKSASKTPRPSAKPKPSKPETPTETAQRIDRERRREKADKTGGSLSKKEERARADQARVDAAKEKAKNLLSGFVKDFLDASKEGASISIIGMNNKQLEVFLKMLDASAELGYALARQGFHKFEDWSRELLSHIGGILKDGIGWNDKDLEDYSRELWSYKYTDENKQRRKLSEHAEEFAKAAETEESEVDERTERENDFVIAIGSTMRARMKSGKKSLTLKELREIAKEYGLEDVSDTDLQEFAETAAVIESRRAMGDTSHDITHDEYSEVVNLHEKQPTLSKRDSDRVEKQQYSTPTPMAAAMAAFCGKGRNRGSQIVLEPSAGNGALTIGFPRENVHVNEIDLARANNLRRQGFVTVTTQDGTKPFSGKYDVVVTNPPFSTPGEKLEPIVRDGFEITGLDGQMAINALDSMRDDGRAAIIVGGHTKYNDRGVIVGKDRDFLGYLYQHYNVVDVINMDGSLYGKNGTKYPTRMILIDGRRTDTSERRYAPVKEKARAEAVTSFEELWERVNEHELKEKKDVLQTTDGDGSRGHDPVAEGGEEANGGGTGGNADGNDNSGVRGGESGGHPIRDTGLPVRGGGRGSETNSGPVESEETGGGHGGEGETGSGDTSLHGAGLDSTKDGEGQGHSAGTGGGRGDGGTGGGRPVEAGANDNDIHHGEPVGGTQPPKKAEEKVGLGVEKTDYQPRSSGNSLGTKTPADMVKATQETLKKIGDVDEYVREKLGYGSKEELFSHLGAEQIDSVAAAIYQMEQGNGFIIGDGTGVGKGRQAAALLRYAMRQGKTPVFVTQKSSLFTDIYRDMLDIGSGEDFHPLIINVADKDTNISMWDEKQGKRVVVFRGMKKGDSDLDALLNTLRSTGELPDGYNCVLLTYSQVASGTTEYNVDGSMRQKRPRNGQSGFAKNQLNGDKKRELLSLLAKDNILVLDESHTAAGNATGFFLPILRDAAGVTYLSGTFAKRPDSMPLYAVRTAIAKGVDNVLELMDAVRRGGVTLQEIMSQQLAKAGQMFRRERPTDGVVNNWIKQEDEALIAEEKKRADTMSDLFRSIIDFEEAFVEPHLETIRDTIRVQQGSTKKGSSKMGIGGVPFASKAYNLVRQMSLALKVDAATDRALQALREGRKPIIAVSNTMERFFDGIPRNVSIPMPDFAETMLRGLMATLDYTEKHPGEPSVKHHINLKDLGPEAEAAYHALEARIKETSSGMTLSPIDAMVMKLTAAGYHVGELTGRKEMLVETSDGMVKCTSRKERDKKLLAEQFNTGKLDVLIVNRSSSTGISLHAGARAPGVNIKDCDTRQREMIFAQLETDINDAIQLLGRINRTGQVHPAIYTYLMTAVPAESRLLMMYKAKLKSLFANTTGNQKNEDTDVDVTDIINKYGDQVVAEYFIENPELYDRLGDPFKTGWTVEMSADEKREGLGRMADLDQDGKWASATLSYLSLLPVEEQIRVIDEISERYNAKLEILNEAGENTLVMNELPLRAKTLSREVVKEGPEPGGDNPFADNTYAETIECDVLVKPMHRSEVDAVISRMSGGATPEEHRKNVLAQLNDKKDAAKESLRERYAKKIGEEPEQAGKRERRRLRKERKEGKNTYTDERINELVEFTERQKRDELERELTNGLIAIDERFEQFVYCVESYLPGDPVSIPYYVRGELEQGGPIRPAILLGWNISKSMSPASCSAVFATNDGRRKVSVVFSDMPSWKSIAIETQKYKKDLSIMAQESNWEKYAKGGGLRERRIMYTGNLLAVLGSETPVAGRIVRYTTEDGEVRTGVLLQEGAEVSYFGKKVPISSCLDDIKALSPDAPFTSDDGEVTIRRTRNGWYSLSVPKSTSRGGRYFLDRELRNLVNGRQFVSIGDTMRAVFEERNLSAVLDRLSTEHKVTITLNGERGRAGAGEREGDVLYSLDEEEGKGTTSSERSGAVSGNSSSGGLPDESSAHPSRSPLASHQDVAKIKRNTEIAKSSARKIINQGGFSGTLDTPAQAIRAIGNALHLEKSKSSQSYYGDLYEGDYETIVR